MAYWEQLNIIVKVYTHITHSSEPKMYRHDVVEDTSLVIKRDPNGKHLSALAATAWHMVAGHLVLEVRTNTGIKHHSEYRL